MEVLIGDNPFGLRMSPTPSLELLAGPPPIAPQPMSPVASIPLLPIIPECPSPVPPPASLQLKLELCQSMFHATAASLSRAKAHAAAMEDTCLAALAHIHAAVARHMELSTWYNVLVRALRSTPQGTALASVAGLLIYDSLEDWDWDVVGVDDESIVGY